MARPIDTAVREQVIEAYRRLKAANRKTTIAQVASDHRVGEASLKRWLWALKIGSVEPTRPAGGAKPKLTSDARKQIAEWAVAHSTARLYEVVAYVAETFGLTVSQSTVRACLHEQGISKRRLTKVAAKAPGAAPPSDHRYTARHRRKPEGRPHRRSYCSDFNNAEWSVVEPLWLNHARALPAGHELRDVVDAFRYICATGSPWRSLPDGYPPSGTVRRWFDTWGRDGTFTRVNDELRRLLRRRAGKEETPSILIIDSLSVKSHEGGEARGYDGGKKINGRKRHIAVDSLGQVWFLKVHGANIQDRDGIDLVIPDDVRKQLPRLEKILTDAGYQGKAEARTELRTGVPVEIVRRRGDTTTGEWTQTDQEVQPIQAGFQVLPKRWIVERSHAWATRRRRLARDFERTISASTAWLELAYNHTYSARAAMR